MSETLTAERVASAVLAAGLEPISPETAARFSAFVALLLRWNARTNLTAIREPGAILDRHIVECVHCAQHLPAGLSTLLDFGSGAGFPGIPIALCRPEIAVTLAESQAKKAAFVREAVRTLGLSAQVHDRRVEALPADRRFDAVTLRAVDDMETAIPAASSRVKPGGILVLMVNADTRSEVEELVPGFKITETIPSPGAEKRAILFAARDAE